jgi:DNA-binding response OmpR family regulator
MSTHAGIALVEDDADLLHGTQEYLTLAGFSVWGAGSAEAFFRSFVADPVDVVVLDIGLPGEDGLSVTELLKKNPQVAVIILSARDGLEDRLAGMRAGAAATWSSRSTWPNWRPTSTLSSSEIFGQRISNAADRLNVLITRLRKKAQGHFAEPLPIKTALQIGYAFTAPALLL